MLKIEAELSASSIGKWFQKSHESMQKAESFVTQFRQFRARKAWTPLRPDGTIDEKSPVYRILSEGTQEEADAGMFVSAPVKTSRLSSITPWSLMPFGDVPIVARDKIFIAMNPCPDPNQYALAYIQEAMYIGPAKFIFASRDVQGECADFFFPVDGDVYLRVTVNPRWSDVRVYGFEGDPMAFATTWARNTRVTEPDLRQVSGARVHRCPTMLALEYKDGVLQEPRPVTIADIMAAAKALTRLPNERGEPHLVG